MSHSQAHPQASAGAPKHPASEVFDRIGERYDEAFAANEGQTAATRELIQRLPSGARVLDAGCGTGRPTAEQLAAAGLEVVGLDVSGVMVALARSRVPDGIFLQGDLHALAEEPAASLGEFDAATVHFVLLSPDEETVAGLRLVRSRLRPGGLLSFAAVQHEESAVQTFFGYSYVPAPCTADSLREVVRKAGFQVLSTSSAYHAPPTGEVSPRTHLFVLAERDVGAERYEGK